MGGRLSERLERWSFVLLAAGFLLTTFAILEFAARARIAVDGVVISSTLDCREPNRCRRIYVLRHRDSDSPFTYVAGPNDESLSQSIPNGATVIKKKGELTYTVDGRVIHDFPAVAYGLFLVLGVPAFLVGCVAGWRRGVRYYHSQEVG